jgi:phosphoglycolate phosphatase
MVIVFDFDGTLADSWEVMVEELQKVALERFGKELTEEHIHWFRSLGATKASRMIAKKEKLSLLTMIKVGMEVQKHVSREEKRVSFYPGIIEMIKDLKKMGHTLGVASANDIKVLGPILKRMGVYKDFSFVTWGRSVLGKKRILARMLKRQKMNKNEVIYVGDQVRDIEAAHKVGIRIIAVEWGFNDSKILKKYRPEWMAKRPGEVVKIIRGL